MFIIVFYPCDNVKYLLWITFCGTIDNMKSIVKRKEKEVKRFDFNEEVLSKIKACVLMGKSQEETAKEIGISQSLYSYHLFAGTANLSVKVRSWEIEKMLKDAERVSREILALDNQNGGKRADASIIAIKQRESAFLREKLRKAGEDYETATQQVNVVVAPIPILGDLMSPKKIDSETIENE